MKKKFILWLCHILKVKLVEPNHPIKLIHKYTDYIELNSKHVINQLDLKQNPKSIHSVVIDKMKTDFYKEIFQPKNPYIQIDQFEDPMNRTVIVKARMFIANLKEE